MMNFLKFQAHPVRHMPRTVAVKLGLCTLVRPSMLLLLLQMYKDLDIDITDEASSTVIHVRGPVSARMCDVGSVFDQLGECCWRGLCCDLAQLHVGPVCCLVTTR